MSAPIPVLHVPQHSSPSVQGMRTDSSIGSFRTGLRRRECPLPKRFFMRKKSGRSCSIPTIFARKEALESRKRTEELEVGRCRLGL